jgi:hypothetical protein
MPNKVLGKSKGKEWGKDNRRRKGWDVKIYL